MIFVQGGNWVINNNNKKLIKKHEYKLFFQNIQSFILLNKII